MSAIRAVLTAFGGARKDPFHPSIGLFSTADAKFSFLFIDYFPESIDAIFL